MTYCLAISVDEGLVFASDSRTNAGLDQVRTYRKMHTFQWPGDRVFVLLSAGNLATTQAVARALQRDLEDEAECSLTTVERMDEAAEYLGAINVERQKHGNRGGMEASQVSLEATFILGGQIGGGEPELYLVYPQGNFITVSEGQSFFQIGETKYGKPILDRIVAPELPLTSAARCALVSIDSTMRSNLTVGPPLDLLLYRRDSLRLPEPASFQQDDPYLVQIRESWNDGVKRLFNELPPFDWEASAASSS